MGNTGGKQCDRSAIYLWCVYNMFPYQEAEFCIVTGGDCIKCKVGVLPLTKDFECSGAWDRVRNATSVTILTFQKFEFLYFFLHQTKLASLSLWKRMFLWKVISLQHNWSLAGVQNYFVYMTTIMVFYCKLQPWLKYHATWPFSKRARALLAQAG